MTIQTKISKKTGKKACLDENNLGFLVYYMIENRRYKTIKHGANYLSAIKDFNSR